MRFLAFPFNDSQFLMNFHFTSFVLLSSITFLISSSDQKSYFMYKTAALLCAEIPFFIYFFSLALQLSAGTTRTHFTHNIPLLLFLRSPYRNTWRLSQYIFFIEIYSPALHNCTFKKNYLCFSFAKTKKFYWRQIYLRTLRVSLAKNCAWGFELRRVALCLRAGRRQGDFGWNSKKF